MAIGSWYMAGRLEIPEQLVDFTTSHGTGGYSLLFLDELPSGYVKIAIENGHL